MNSDPASSNQELCFNGAITGLAITGLVPFASDRMVMKQLRLLLPNWAALYGAPSLGLQGSSDQGKIYGMQHGINMIGKN